MGPVLLAMLSAALFGISAPISKVLLEYLSPQQLAGLLYLGTAAGIAPAVFKSGLHNPLKKLSKRDKVRVSVVFIAGGIIAPILLMMALKLGNAVTVSMLLCLESPITALFAHFMFREHIGKKDWVALAGTTIACVLLSFNVGWFGLLSSLCAVGACVCWALDNNMVSVIDSITASEITFLKGLCAGSFNFVLGLTLAAVTAPPQMFAYAFLFGATCYGVSIYLYIKAAQKIGAGRSQIIFSSAPFWGVAVSALVLHEQIGLLQYTAGAIFIASLSLLMRQPHGHVHVHEPLTHTHEHSHDDGHHQHAHEDGTQVDDKHTHSHTHDATEHSHPHWPDSHHRHSH